jgi:gliding motility-associated-like protein
VITVNSVNDAPVAINDVATTDEDTQTSGMVATNDSDVDLQDVLSYSIVSTTSHGTITLSPVGAFIYTPALNFNGKDTLTYKVCDNGTPSLCDTAILVITVNPVNDAPVALNDVITTAEDTPVTGSVATNDSDVDGDVLSFVPIHTTSHGTLLLNTNGSYTYTPVLDFFGKDTLTYQVCDNGTPALCDTAILVITVTPVNDPPVAVDDMADMTNPRATALISILANDTDVDNLINPASVVIVSGPHHGTISVSPATGVVSYTPFAGFTGKDSLTYTVKDMLGLVSNVATVRITVPTLVIDAIDDNFSTALNGAHGGVAGNVLTNDLFNTALITDSSDVVISLVNNGGISGLTVTTGGNLVVPAGTFEGTYTVRYSICETANPTNCDQADATIVIGRGLQITTTPVCRNDVPYMAYEVTPNFNPASANELKVTWMNGDGSALNPAVEITSLPLQGELLWPGAVLDTDGNIIDWPGWYIDNGIWVQGADGFENTRPNAMLMFSVNPTETVTVSYPPASPFCNAVPFNRAPVAVADIDTTMTGVPVTITVLTNDSDFENGALSVTALSAQSQNGGTVTVNSNGTITYTSVSGYTGTDVFSYSITDAAGLSDTTTVSVFVVIPPTAVDDQARTNPDVPVSISLPANDVAHNYRINPASVTVITNPVHGTVSVDATGTVLYTPASAYFGLDSMTYTIADTAGFVSNIATVRIRVNTPPVAVDDADTTPEETLLNGSVALNDSDFDGDALTFSVITNTQHGVLNLNTDGTFSYLPGLNYHGTDTLVYRVCDIGSLCDTAKLVITVTPVNDAPVALNDAYVTQVDVDVNNDVSVNDSDIDGDQLIFAVLPSAQPKHGMVNMQIDGKFTYTPDANFMGVDSFSYAVCDNGIPSLCDTAVVTITMLGVDQNHPPVAVNDTVTIPQDATWYGNVSLNDSDPDTLNVLAFRILTNPAHGIAAVNPDGTYRYTPDPGFIGVDSFRYTACDNGIPYLCDTATVILNVSFVATPSVGAAKAVDPPVMQADGSYNLTYRINVKNYGNLDMTHVRVKENLNATFPSPAVYTVVSANTSGSLNINPFFNGNTDINLLDSTASKLTIGESGLIILTVNVIPNAPLSVFNNSVTLIAKGAHIDTTVSDVSTKGFNPDPNGNGKPSDAGEDAATDITITLFVPNGYSPDGDGVNDKFTIPGIENFPLNKLEIFNRWGNKVYQKAPYDNSWNGNTANSGGLVLNDGTLPNGTYFYILDFGVEGMKPLTGYVIIRK